ncbi:MAG: hybrid sensor histidine kinase/response regulator [Stygiobacter sp.]|uniref:histidine kinase n=1 Tax=Stygiobacter electus TaxID=3032292 RepID=A0AAE3NYY5_9BACT|nr:hybrid sensor histidine kinase/response regulator [Stygiobacter electus]MDF1611307.1 hybrid sensor histidine kinase/response regulator [Stygiobacter electus]
MTGQQKDISLKHAIHDLNSLFTKILNSIELLKSKTDKSNKNFLLINSIETNIYLASEIIEELISQNKDSRNFHLVNINSVIKEVVNSFPQSKNKNVNLVLNLSSTLRLINGKYSDFFRLIMNLVSNSYEAIQQKGEIILSTSNLGSEILIEIKDNGIGIEKDNIPKIFEDNFSTKHKSTNLGVGLSIVKNIVDKYNGRILVDSKKNEGTTFRIYFLSEETVERKFGTNKKILIAEDENILRELLTELFLSYDFQVTSVQDGNEFLEELFNNRYDILIVDKNIPHVGGTECVKIIRNRNINVPIILASGSSIENGNEINSLVQKIITKPYNFEELLKAVNEILV